MSDDLRDDEETRAELHQQVIRHLVVVLRNIRPRMRASRDTKASLSLRPTTEEDTDLGCCYVVCQCRNPRSHQIFETKETRFVCSVGVCGNWKTSELGFRQTKSWTDAFARNSSFVLLLGLVLCFGQSLAPRGLVAAVPGPTVSQELFSACVVCQEKLFTENSCADVATYLLPRSQELLFVVWPSQILLEILPEAERIGYFLF